MAHVSNEGLIELAHGHYEFPDRNINRAAGQARGVLFYLVLYRTDSTKTPTALVSEHLYKLRNAPGESDNARPLWPVSSRICTNRAHLYTPPTHTGPIPTKRRNSTFSYFFDIQYGSAFSL